MIMSSITSIDYHIAHHMLVDPDWIFDRQVFIDELEKSYGVATVKTDVDSYAWTSTRPGRPISLGLTLVMIREIHLTDSRLRAAYPDIGIKDTVLEKAWPYLTSS